MIVSEGWDFVNRKTEEFLYTKFPKFYIEIVTWHRLEMIGAFFMPAARIRPGFFMPFLRGGGLGGEPNQGHYGGDWRQY